MVSICLIWCQGHEDGDLIDMAFAKKRVEDRKDWLKAFTKGTHVDYKASTHASSTQHIHYIHFPSPRPPRPLTLFFCNLAGGEHDLRRLHQPGAGPLLHGRQPPLHPLHHGRTQALPAKGQTAHTHIIS